MWLTSCMLCDSADEHALTGHMSLACSSSMCEEAALAGKSNSAALWDGLDGKGGFACLPRGVDVWRAGQGRGMLDDDDDCGG